MRIDEYNEIVVRNNPERRVPNPKERIAMKINRLNCRNEDIDNITRAYHLHGETLDTQHLVDKLGDVVQLITELAFELDYSLEDILQMNADTLRRRESR